MLPLPGQYKCVLILMQVLHTVPRGNDGLGHKGVAVVSERPHPAGRHRCHDSRPDPTIQVQMLQGASPRTSSPVIILLHYAARHVSTYSLPHLAILFPIFAQS